MGRRWGDGDATGRQSGAANVEEKNGQHARCDGTVKGMGVIWFVLL